MPDITTPRNIAKRHAAVRAGLHCAQTKNRRRANYWLRTHRRLLGLPQGRRSVS